MKKKDIALIVGVLLIIVVGVLSLGKNETKKIEYELPLVLNGDAGLQEITYKEYEEKIDSLEPFVFIVERTNCTFCQQFMPVVEKFATDYNIPIYYINTDNISSDEFALLLKSNTFFKKNRDDWGTPTTMILIGNEAIDVLEGAREADVLYDFLEKSIEFESNN